MARERNYAAEYAARKARAAARGTTVYRQRDASAVRQGFAGYSQRRAAMRAHKASPDTGRVNFGNGEFYVTSRRDDVLTAAINRAAEADLRIYARVTIATDPGDGTPPSQWDTRDVELWSKGGYSAINAADAMDAGALAFLADQLNALEKYAGVILDVQIRAVAGAE